MALRKGASDPRPITLASAVLLLLWGAALALIPLPDVPYDVFEQIPIGVQWQGAAVVSVGLVGILASPHAGSRVFLLANILLGVAWLWPALEFFGALGLVWSLIYFGMAGLNAWAVYRYFCINPGR